MFSRPETVRFGTDAGWVRQAHFNVQSPLGSAVDNITTLALGSLTRSFEVVLSPDRYAELAALLNVTSSFTDWQRPLPDSRPAVMMDMDPLEYLIQVNPRNGATEQRIRTKLTFLSQ